MPGPKQMSVAKVELGTCWWRQAGGCWLPSPACSGRHSCGGVPAASLSQTADAKKNQNCPDVPYTDEYFIVVPGKAFKRTHKTTIVWSCLGTQIKNISNLTFKGKVSLNDNIIS